MGTAAGPITQHFARVVAQQLFAALATAAVMRAKASILDAVGCMLAGARSDEARILRGALLEAGGRAAVVGTALRVDPGAAALANGTAGHAHDYDDSSPPMIGHPSVPIMAALIALADTTQGASGQEVIASYVAGLEIGAGLGRRMNPAHYAAGWHATATLGTLAAALAGARLMRLDPRRASAAIGIAAAGAGGIRKNFGSMIKPLHAGLAARNGVQAVRLAAAGFTADPAALDGDNGFVDVFGGAGAQGP